MRDHLRPVRLFGRDYFWHAEPGQPLRLVPWPEPPPRPPETWYETFTRLYGRPMPWPEEKIGA